MACFIRLLSLSLPLALLAGGAVGQTVADYGDALAAAPTADVAGCRTLTNYAYTAIPDGGRAAWVLPLVTINGSESSAVAERREACVEARKQPLIVFDGGTGEEILTPADVYHEPVGQPYYRDPAALPDAGAARAGGRVARPRVGAP